MEERKKKGRKKDRKEDGNYLMNMLLRINCDGEKND